MSPASRKSGLTGVDRSPDHNQSEQYWQFRGQNGLGMQTGKRSERTVADRTRESMGSEKSSWKMP